MESFKKDLYFKINVKIWFDEKSNSWIYYNKKYNISSYGKTTKKANKMFHFQLNEILKIK